MALASVVSGVVGFALMMAGLSPAAQSAPLEDHTKAQVAPAGPTGATPDTAAASCWEIDQTQPDAPTGSYWLLTPKMTGPGRFWCDMTTDGGGWVRIASGREQWTTGYDGKGDPADLRVSQPAVTAATQLSSTTVDALLDGGRVDQLQDQIRIRRAADATGSTFQEVRFQYQRRDRWVWTLGAEHRVSTFSFDGVAGTGGQTSNFGTDQAFSRVNAAIQTEQNFTWGFGYGSGVTGTNSPTTYLWTSTDGRGGALPYSEVYVRPRLMSSDLTFPPAPDAGTAAIEGVAGPSSRALVNTWGVDGTAGSVATEGNVEVQALEQIGNVMFVGGNFAHVQRDAQGAGRVEQPFLAAFDATTGDFIPGFAPVLDEQVRTLKALPDGNLAVGGDFTRANGQAVQGLVAVNPVTGQSVAGWGTRIENGISPGVVRVGAMDVAGPHLYLGGTFTHLSAADGTGRVFARNAGRVSITDGRPDAWNPEFNGTVLDLATSDDGARAYFSGFFSTSGANPAFRAAAVMTGAGAPLDPVPWVPTWSSSQNYQRAVEQAGDTVWVGGSEHSLFEFATSTYERQGGSITKRGGDFQVIETQGAQLFAGCHCNNWVYQDAYTFPSVGSAWTQADAIGWFGQWDSGTGSYVPQFTPEVRSRLGSGIWAIKVAADGTVWAGGDVTSGRTTAGDRWLGGFGRWAPRDVTAPNAPSNLRIESQGVTTVALAWNAAPGGAAGYQVLRDGRVIGSTPGTGRTLTVPNGGQNRFFVRAVDAAGNASTSTPVLVSRPGDTTAPQLEAFDFTPTSVDVTAADQVVSVTARITDDASGAQEPTVEFRHDNGSGTTDVVSLARVEGTRLDGTYRATVTVSRGASTGTWSAVLSPLRDEAGNVGVAGPPAGFPRTLTVTGTVTAPAAPTGVSATPGDGSATVSWSAPSATGGAPINSYQVTSAPEARTAIVDGGTTTGTVTGLTNGTAYTFTVTATNSAGTSPASAASAPVTPAAATDRVTRIWGANRFETAAKVATGYPTGLPTVYIASGRDYPDALAGAALAGKAGAPILLVQPDGIPTATSNALTALSPQRIVILGGAQAVSTDVQKLLAAYVP